MRGLWLGDWRGWWSGRWGGRGRVVGWLRGVWGVDMEAFWGWMGGVWDSYFVTVKTCVQQRGKVDCHGGCRRRTRVWCFFSAQSLY